MLRELVQDRLRAGVTLPGAVGEPLRLDTQLARPLLQGRATRHLLPAPPPSEIRPATGQPAERSGGAVLAAQEPARTHDGAADASTDRNQEGVPFTLSSSEARLAQ